MNYNNIFTEERTAEATGERLINRAEFKEAVKEVMEKQINDPEIEGMAKVFIPMTGSIFASEMEKILFGKKKQEG